MSLRLYAVMGEEAGRRGVSSSSGSITPWRMASMLERISVVDVEDMRVVRPGVSDSDWLAVVVEEDWLVEER